VWLTSSERAIYLARIDSLTSPAYEAALMLFDAMRLVGGSLAVVVLVVLLRLLVRRMWLADLLGAVLLGSVLGGISGWVYQQYIGAALGAMLVGLVMLMLLRRFGLLTLWAALGMNFVVTVPLGVVSWYAGRSLMAMLVPTAVAAWAAWVIVTAQRRPAADSAG
jgi:hypothetical protein